MGLILPLHPRWATSILIGLKTVEVRRKFTQSDNLPATALIYTTSPVKAITGYATISRSELLPESQIRMLRHQTCIPDQELSAYLRGGTGTVAHIESPRTLFDPIPLDMLRERFAFTAPQNFAFSTPALDAFVFSQPVLEIDVTRDISHPHANQERTST